MATPAEKKPAVARDTAPAQPAVGADGKPKAQGGGLKLLLGLGGLVVLIVGVGVGWTVFTARMEEKMKGQGGEERIYGEARTGPPGHERKSREIGGEIQQMNTVQGVNNAVDPDEEDLSAPEKKKKAVKVAAQAVPSNLPPVERTWRNLKADYERLESNNETNARKFRMRFNVLEDKRSSLAEAAFIKEANALDDQIRAELAKPENQ
ncbi:MAG: hypothetical protein QM723_24880 [Myxococcaceae bacterium]